MKALVIFALVVAAPVSAQTYGSSNCYVAGRLVTCNSYESAPAQQPSQPAYQQMLNNKLQQDRADWAANAENIRRARQMAACRQAARDGDQAGITAYCS